MVGLARIVTLVLFVASGPAWAGPAEEVAELAVKRGQAFSQGNAEAFTADFADNAVFTPGTAVFRVEGKNAIRAFFSNIFQQYPQRINQGRQVTARVYANDTLVVVNAYADQTWIDKSGKTTFTAIRSSTTWAKIDGKWVTIDFHVSRAPNLN
jgi:uncharacterized protein (TIGR02246 family)